MPRRKQDDRGPKPPVRIDLNAVRAPELVRLTGCTRHYASVLVHHRPYQRAEDLFRVPELCAGVAGSRNLRLLFSWGFAEGENAPPPVGDLLEMHSLLGGTRIEIRNQPNGNVRVSIIHPLGAELISGEISDAGHDGVEPASLRILGAWPHELLRWRKASSRAAIALLRSDGTVEAASLWRGEIPEVRDAGANRAVRRLSRDLAVVQHFCQQAPALPDEVTDPEWDWTTDGCGSGGVSVPDGDWVECCNQHDICYSFRGNTPAGRSKCDSALADCVASKGAGINAAGHGIVSVIYWCGVRIGGCILGLVGTSGHRGESINPEWPDNRKPPLYHEGVDRGCTYWLNVLSIEQIRDPSGIEDFEIEFGHGPGEPVDYRTRAHIPFRGEKSFGFVGETVMKGTAPHCGGRVRKILYIRCVTTEIGKMYFFDFFCDGGEEEYTLIMPIRHSSGARFRLSLRLTTSCIHVP